MRGASWELFWLLNSKQVSVMILHEPEYFEKTPIEKQRVCCNCGNCDRVEEKGHTNTYCAIDGHYIGYIECFEGWCRRWRKDRKWDE